MNKIYKVLKSALIVFQGSNGTSEREYHDANLVTNLNNQINCYTDVSQSFCPLDLI
jgi:hypothetical protein